MNFQALAKLIKRDDGSKDIAAKLCTSAMFLSQAPRIHGIASTRKGALHLR
jgi:hypothetical protein